MKRGFTLIEVLVCVAIVFILVALVVAAVTQRYGDPKVVATQPIGVAEAAGTRSMVKVHYSQIETYLAGLPGNVRIVAVVPIYSGSGDTFDIASYLVVSENSDKK